MLVRSTRYSCVGKYLFLRSVLPAKFADPAPSRRALPQRDGPSGYQRAGGRPENAASST